MLGKVLTERDDPLVSSFPELPVLAAVPVFRVLSTTGAAGVAPLDLLIGELRAIVETGWHPSVILKPGAAAPVPFRGNQGAGYTLEALLGVAANAAKEPDAHGYEIKSYRGSRISLMTPTPDGGFQGERSFRVFMARYGRPAVKDDGSRRFTGLHRVGKPCSSTGFELRVKGYDAASDTFDADIGIAVEMFDPAAGDVVASWSLERLANSWNAKHASALYIFAEARESDLEVEYRYAREALVGEGTDVFRLLRAVHTGLVYYDPADTVYANGDQKVRPQWRMSSANLEYTMAKLYATVRCVAL